MRIVVWMLCAAAGMWMLAGCQRGAIEAKGNKEYLTVDFKEGQILRYKQVSNRQVELDFDPSHKISRGDSGRIQHISEKLEMVVAYSPVKVDESGFSTVEATFERVSPSRTTISGRGPSEKDAVMYLQGKSIRFIISPSGTITDPCGFEAMVKQLGREAFGGKGGGVKNPDMIQDFITLERMMWDAVSSIARPVEGVAVGQKWKSQLMAPMPMPMRVGRDVTYKLVGVEDVNGSRIADINSICNLSDRPLDAAVWPIPYSGSFQMRGTFGFLGGYKVLSLAGSGTERFNIDAGRVEKIEQQYEADVSAQMPFGLGSGPEGTPTPNMVLRQKLSVELLAQ
jgi:hypothetical protein